MYILRLGVTSKSTLQLDISIVFRCSQLIRIRQFIPIYTKNDDLETKTALKQLKSIQVITPEVWKRIPHLLGQLTRPVLFRKRNVFYR